MTRKERGRVKQRRYPGDIIEIVTLISAIFSRVTRGYGVLEVAREKLFLELREPGGHYAISYVLQSSRLSTATSTDGSSTSSTSSHPARIHLKCPRTGALKPDESSLSQREPARYRPNFRATRRCPGILRSCTMRRP